MRSKHGFRCLFWIIVASLVFLVALIVTITRRERSIRERRERHLLALIEAQDCQQKRQAYVRNMCYTDYGWRPLNRTDLEAVVSSVHSALDHLIVDDANQLIYCFVPKVASTNWKRVLLALNTSQSNASESPVADSQVVDPLLIKGNESHMARAFTTLSQLTNVSEVAHRLTNYYKFLFVRHPYERLLSAFRNKFENTYSDYFRQRFGRKIVRMRSNPTNESLERAHDVTFNEFVEYVTGLNRSDHKRHFNEHWRPIFDLCHPCLLDYDLIGKYETLRKDAQLVLWKVRLSQLVQFPKREDTYSYEPSSHLMARYYRNISEPLIDRLARLYADDLKIFQYEADINFTDTYDSN